MPGKMVRRFHSRSSEDTLAWGELLGARLAKEYRDGAVVLLVGPLGAGKTVIAKGVARGLGVRDLIISPTYTIISEYRTPAGALHHVDLYRIEGKEQLENLGLEDILRGGGVVLVEWGEKIEAGKDSIRVTITLSSDGGRDIVMEEGGA